MSTTRLRVKLRRVRLPDVLELVVVGAFVVVALTRIEQAGLLYDEALFVNAALGGIDENFVYQRLGGVPVLLMSYIGALKAWLYAPIFAIWGVTVETIRVPALLIMAASLYAYGRLAGVLFGRFLGLALLLLLATDPPLFFASRIDLGPNAIMSLAKALALLLFFAWLRRPTNVRLAGLLVCLALGVFDKLNFVWFVLALAAASLVFHRRVVRGLRRTSPGSWLLLGVPAGFLGYFAFARILPLFRNYEGSSTGVPIWSWDRLVHVRMVLEGTLSGEAFRAILFKDPPADASLWAPVIAGACCVVVLAIALSSTRRPQRVSPIPPWAILTFFLILASVTLLQIFVTRQATGPHHFFAVYPDPHFLVVSTVFLALCSLPSAMRRVASYLVVVAVGGLAVLQTERTSEYLDRTKDSTDFANWSSPAIYDLARHVEEREPDRIVSVEWGLHNQLFALAPPERRGCYRDQWLFLTYAQSRTQEGRERFFAENYEGKRVLSLLYAPGAGDFPGDRENFLEFRAEVLGEVTPPEVIVGPRGQPLYEIYESSPASRRDAMETPRAR